MDQIFWLQVVISFLAGGIIISGLTLTAEKVPKSIAGIILPLPSTMAVGLLFLSLSNGIETINESLSSTPVTLAGAVIYVCLYLLVARYGFRKEVNRTLNIIFCCFFALLGWLSIPTLIWYYGEIPLKSSIILFFVLLIITQIFLLKLNTVSDVPVPKTKIRQKDIYIRMITSGTVVACAMIIAKTLGPVWGAIVGTSFPAAYTSQLVIFHSRYGNEPLVGMFRMIPLGTINQLFYILAVWYFFPKIGIWWGTLASYGVSIAGIIILSFVSHRVHK